MRDLIGAEENIGAGLSSASIPAFAKLDESALRKLKSASRSGAGGLAGLVGGTRSASADISKASNGIFAGAAQGPIGVALAAFNGGAAGAQRGGGNNNRSNKKSSSNPKLCPDDIFRLDRYAAPSQLGRIVDEAVVQTKFSEFLIGFSGTNVDGSTRYVYSNRGWFDLQHVVSAAFNTLASFNLSVVGGIVIEIVQFPKHPDSSFRGEDLRSNRIGQKAARIQKRSRYKKSIGESVVEALSRHTLYTESKADDVLFHKNPC